MPHRRLVAGLAVGALLLTAAGCGRGTSPAEAVPGLATRLDSVDAAIADRDDDQTRAALRALITSTTRAQRAGDLDQGEADQITKAASALLDQLPEQTPTDEATPAESTTESSPNPPQTSANSTPAQQPQHGHRNKHDKGKHNGKGH